LIFDTGFDMKPVSILIYDASWKPLSYA